MTRSDLIQEIEEFAERHKLAPATVTSRAVGNSRLYRRMKAGGGCNIMIAERLRNFMRGPEAEQEPERKAS